MSDFRVMLRRYRLAAGLTQEQLAERAGISARGMSDLERGLRRSPRLETVNLLAEALGLTPEQTSMLRAASRPEALTGSRARASVDVHTNPLPEPLTPLIGRERAVAMVTAALGERGVRLLTLTGTGGVGKTRLALAAAREVAPHVRDGVCFVTLAALTDAELVPTTIASALHLTESGAGPITARLVAHLRDRQLLLVADNCEHLDAACAGLLTELLANCPQLTVLATSRSPLRLTGEQEYQVDPLALPGTGMSAREIRDSPAVALLLARALAVDPGAQFGDAELTAIAAICRRLDGIPLAIELAAARFRLLTPAAVLARLEKPLSLLTSGPRDLPQRQETVRRTIDWSHALLSEPEQILFARLAVFAGGATLDAIESVIGMLGLSGEETLSSVDGLVRASLLNREGGVAGEPRFRMLETIREYASERLAVIGGLDALRQAHAGYYLNLAERANLASNWDNPDDPRWFDRLEADQDNLRGALTWIWEQGNGSLDLRLATALGWYWMTRGSFAEGRSRLQHALAASPDKPSAARGFAYGYLGRMSGHQSDDAAAVPALEQSVEIFRAIGDPKSLSWALHGLGRVLLWLGERERGLGLLEESLALSHGKDRGWGNVRGIALVVLGCELLDSGDHHLIDRAVSLLEEAVALGRASGYVETEGFALIGLGWAAYYEDGWERARTLFEEALGVSRAFRHLLMSLDARISLAWLALSEGRLDAASRAFREGLRQALEVENLKTVGDCLRGLAGIASAQGEPERAARLFGAGTRLRERVGRSGNPSNPAYRAMVAVAQAHCDAATWATAWEAGLNQPLDDAVTEALTIGC